MSPNLRSLASCSLWILALLLPACDDGGYAHDVESDGSEHVTPAGPDAVASDQAPSRAAPDCCAAGGEAGCSDVGVQSCVCDVDPYCCNTQWDGLCVGEVESLGCGSCEATAPCCVSSASPGCELPSVESCVCASDPYCCNNQWDGICVNEVESLGCGSCNAIDLAVTELIVPPTACRNEDIGPLVELVVTNYGSSGLGSSVPIGWYLSSDDVLDGSDPLLIGGRDSLPALGAGASTSISMGSNIIRPTAPLGSSYLIVKVDEFDAVVETDEPNNIAAVPIEITSTCASEWTLGLGGSGNDSGMYVAADDSGNVYVLGTTSSPSIDLGSGPVSPANTDLFLASFDAAGNARWSRLLGGSGSEFPGSLGVDGAGNVYVAGESRTAIDLGGGTLPLEGFRDLWVASYTSGGAHRWSQRHGAAGVTVGPNDMGVNASGDVVVVGRVNGSVDLGGGLRTGNGGRDVFALALSSTGAHQWSRVMGGTEDDGADGVGIDASGNALIAGDMGSSADFGSGTLSGPAGVVVRVGSTGITQWARTFGNRAEDAMIDASGEGYVVGHFYGTTDLGDGPHASAGDADVLVARYSSSGTLRWSAAGGSTAVDYAGAITVDDAGTPIAIGSFTGPSFDFGGESLAGAGDDDVWLMSFDVTTGDSRWAVGLSSATEEIGLDLAVSPTGAVLITGGFFDTFTAGGSTVVANGARDAYVASLRR